MIGGIGITPVLAHGLSPVSLTVLIAVVGVFLPAFAALLVGWLGKVLCKHHSTAWRVPFQVLTVGALAAVQAIWIRNWFGQGGFSNFMTLGIGGMVEELIMFSPPLLLTPYSVWLWRWIAKDRNNGVFR